MKYKSFAQKLGLELYANEIKKALTHKSFCTTDETKSNSRFVFLGMYGFKGQVAEILYNYLPAEGTQLQHYLGNIFKDEILIRIFDKYKLINYIRFSPEFDSIKHRHIFVYGFLGFLLKYAKTEKLNKFIINNFLVGTEHLIPSYSHNKDIKSQCNYFAMLVYRQPITLKTEPNQDKTFTTRLFVGELALASATSKGFKYSRSKAIKQALVQITSKLSNEYAENPVYLQYTAQRQKEEQNKKAELSTKNLRKRLEKFEQRKLERAKKKKAARELAQQRDVARRKAKQAAKQRKEKATDAL